MTTEKFRKVITFKVKNINEAWDRLNEFRYEVEDSLMPDVKEGDILTLDLRALIQKESK